MIYFMCNNKKMAESKLIPIETLKDCYSSKELLYGDYVILREVKNILNRHLMKWWLDGGSLIGALRHNSFVPVDDDIDICIEYKEFYTMLPKLKKDFRTAGYSLKAGNGGHAVEDRDGKRWKTFYQFFVTRNKYLQILQELYPKESKQNLKHRVEQIWDKPQPYGDFLLMEELENGKIQYLGDYYGNKPYDKNTIFPLQSFNMLKESDIMIPHKPVPYLMRSYNSTVSPVTNAVIWNVHAPPDNPICNERRKVDMLDKKTLQSMNHYLKSVFGDLLTPTTVKSLRKFQA
jgi:hypothetical protein